MRCYGPERSLIERQLGGDFGHVAELKTDERLLTKPMSPYLCGAKKQGLSLVVVPNLNVISLDKSLMSAYVEKSHLA